MDFVCIHTLNKTKQKTNSFLFEKFIYKSSKRQIELVAVSVLSNLVNDGNIPHSGLPFPIFQPQIGQQKNK
jgi:hypothetical protein